MSQNIDKISRRKENIETIDPLISAMRTISLSNWRSSLNREKNLKSYINQLEGAQVIVKNNTSINNSNEILQKKILYVFGSNRGLCGNFNKNIHKYFVNEGLGINDGLEIILIGKRLTQIYKQAKLTYQKAFNFPDVKNIQDFAISLSSSAATNLQHSSISVLYNKYIGASKYIPALQRIYPRKDFHHDGRDIASFDFIIDTDPLQLIRAIEFMLLNSHLQLCLLSSLASESSARFSIMENAGRNVDDLINELEIIIQDHRRGKITTETQELAVSSGLLNSNE